MIVVACGAAKANERRPAMDLYTAANPFMIVCFQLLISRTFGKMRPIRSMVVGSVVIGVIVVLIRAMRGRS